MHTRAVLIIFWTELEHNDVFCEMQTFSKFANFFSYYMVLFATKTEELFLRTGPLIMHLF